MATTDEKGSECSWTSYEKYDYFKCVWNIKDYSKIQRNVELSGPKFQFKSVSTDLKYEFSTHLKHDSQWLEICLKNENQFSIEIRTQTYVKDTCGKILHNHTLRKKFEIDTISVITSYLKVFSNLCNDALVVICHIYCNPHFVTEIIPHIPVETPSSIIMKYDFLQNSEYADVTLRASDGTAVRGHKVILSAVSSVFKAMLQTNMQECVNSEIFVEDVSMPVLKKLLKYIYGGDVQPLTFEEAMELYYAADKYLVAPLREVCTNVIKAKLSEDNAHDVLKFAHQHSDKILYRHTLNFLEQNFADKE